MKTLPTSFVVVLAFALPGLASAQTPNINKCLELPRASITLNAWRDIKTYFASITRDRKSFDQQQMTSLSGQIADLIAAKGRVVKIVRSHIASAAGRATGEALSVNEMPSLLGQIEFILSDLNSLAERGNLFAGEKAFTELKVTLTAKRESTLCELSAQMSSERPDQAKLRELSDELVKEKAAIEEAQRQLGEYISKTYKAQ